MRRGDRRRSQAKRAAGNATEAIGGKRQDEPLRRAAAVPRHRPPSDLRVS